MNDAWISGQRRAQSMTRSSVALVEVDEARGKLKFNPLANWSDSDIAAYKAEHALPEHPLVARGFLQLAVTRAQALSKTVRIKGQGVGVVNRS